jgi:hypothetical protein
LGSSSGQYVTYQVINSADQPISDVAVTATRPIGSETYTVAYGTTNAAGAVTFWLNYNFEHTLSFVKSGYDTYNFVVIPLSTEYTITLGGSSTIRNDYLQGVSIKINPTNDFLYNGTTYNFNLSLKSDYWEVDEFGFSLYFGNGTLIGSQVSYANGGILNLDASTSNQSSIYMRYYYVIDSNYTYDSRTWIIQTNTGREYSIWQWFSDLNRYINTGRFFGFDEFGKIILSILVIILAVGGIARYGVNNDAALMGVAFGVVYFLDIIDFLPQVRIGDIVPIDHFITFIVFIMMIALMIREEI